LALNLLCKALRNVCNTTALSVKKTQLTEIP
ncbi:MAG: hypothetical protein ACI9WC_003060, partial [Arenicella sp.]